MTAVADVQAPMAEALEPRLYLDPELVEVEQERIFERTWQLIGHVSALPGPGSYTTGFAGTQLRSTSWTNAMNSCGSIRSTVISPRKVVPYSRK